MAKEKAVKAPVAINSTIATDYASLIESSESNNLDALNFIKELGDKLGNGITEEIAKESMKSVLNDVNLKPVVLPSHVSAVKVASRIIARFEGEISEIKASKVLSLATRIICDKKASGAEKHIKESATFADLDEATLTKAESQARDGKAQKTQAIKESAKAITLESAIDGFSTWLKAQDLKTLKTTEPQKLDALISKLIQVSKNSKAEVKVNA
jgi:hypothetical protein